MSATNERRAGLRYPVETEVEYRLLRGRKLITGRGTTINLSSGGVLFQSGQAIPEGMRIEMSIAWPARLNEVTRLSLHVTGRTVRSQGKYTAVKVMAHEFRTRGTAGVLINLPNKAAHLEG